MQIKREERLFASSCVSEDVERKEGYAVTMQFILARICKDMQKNLFETVKNAKICKDLQGYER